MNLLFKIKKERKKEKRIKYLLERTDKTIERIEKQLEEMWKDDENGKKNNRVLFVMQ